MICRRDISRFPYVTKNTVTVSELPLPVLMNSLLRRGHQTCLRGLCDLKARQRQRHSGPLCIYTSLV